MSSYRTQCRKCSRLIQLRKMPNGRWVAFEGYDTPHTCNVAVEKTKSAKKSREEIPKYSHFDQIDFPDIDIDKAINESSPKGTTRQKDLFKPKPLYAAGHLEKQKKVGGSNSYIIFWIILLFAVLLGITASLIGF